MSEDYQKEIDQVQKNLEKEEPHIKEGSDTCPLCKHPSSKDIVEFYYEQDRDIEKVKQWFFNKFKRSYSDNSWNNHIQNHVVPFFSNHEVKRKIDLNNLVQKSIEIKKDSSFNPASVVKQMLLELMLDSYSSRPKDIDTKEEMNRFNNCAKTINSLASTFQKFYQMDIDMLGMGKTEEEQKEMMTNYIKGMLKDIVKMFGDKPDVQQRIADSFGISLKTFQMTEDVEIEDVKE